MTGVGVCLFLAGGALAPRGQAAPSTGTNSEARLLTVEGQVEVFPVSGQDWVGGKADQVLNNGDRIRTSERSRATVRLSDLTVLRINELTTMQITPPRVAGQAEGLDFKRTGGAYYLGRGRPGQHEIRTPLTSGAVRGTEFNLKVAEDGRTEVALLEGAMNLSNEHGQVDIFSEEMALVETDRPPVKTPMVEAINIIQWCLYYPGVLNPAELELSPAERERLADALEAYSKGDLLHATRLAAKAQRMESPSATVFEAATLLSSGQVEQAADRLSGITNRDTGTRSARLAAALLKMVAAVKNQDYPGQAAPEFATEWMAESYYMQSKGRLEEALMAARTARAVSPQFGFAYARVAELEVGFGRERAAQAELQKSLALSPLNAQSHAVQGFILLNRGKPRQAQQAFDEALRLDGGLDNAWLGRGLCQIRRGQARAGLEDLQTAAVMQPRRSVLRSYLGKAFANAGDVARARNELRVAQELDPNDPTAPLYSALVDQQENQINEAVRNLEKSKELNDNRRIYRSRLLLDQDLAVRGASLAYVYQDTGLMSWNKDVPVSEWSLREASRAVAYDYANFSSHQFLAGSYDAFRDPNQINLRYESQWLSELLMAHLLAPVGAGNLSEFTQQPTFGRLLDPVRGSSGRFFDQNDVGLYSSTVYTSHGDWFERGSQYGTWGPATYAADFEYRTQRGWRRNNDLEQFSATVRGKYEITPDDSVFIQGVYYDAEFGDVGQYYYQYGTTNYVVGAPSPSMGFRGHEKQWASFNEPNLLMGYHHQWAPGVHTVVLGGHFTDELGYSESISAGIPFTSRQFGNFVVRTDYPFQTSYNRDLEAWSAELQQIWQTPRQILVVGGRYQTGWNDVSGNITNGISNQTIVSQKFSTDFDRFSIYGYETFKILDTLQLTAGVSYEYWEYPENIDTLPMKPDETNLDQVSPKAGLVWSPLPRTHLRAYYTRSLGGVTGPEVSYRLEPTQVAGFNQVFRSVLPESVAGLVPGTSFTTYGAAWEQSFGKGSYLSLQGLWIESDGTRTIGAMTNSTGFIPVPDTATSLRQHLDYWEKSLVLSFDQLLTDEWSVGVYYKLGYAKLNDYLLGLSPTVGAPLNQHVNATLNQVGTYINYYNKLGFFGQFQALWFGQDNEGYLPNPLPGDSFWQLNLFGGYRFMRRAAEVKLGLLNITDQDYLLNPLNLYYDLPRGRTLMVSLKLSF